MTWYSKLWLIGVRRKGFGGKYTPTGQDWYSTRKECMDTCNETKDSYLEYKPIKYEYSDKNK